MNQQSPPKPASRPARAARTQAILAAAREAIEAHGYEGARIAQIASAIGVVEGTVFHYFPSKSELALAVMEQFYEQITLGLNEGLKGAVGSGARLHFVIAYHLGVLAKNAALCRVILGEFRGNDKSFSNQIRRFNRQYTSCLVDIVQQGISAGEIAKGTSAQLVRNTVFGSIEHHLWSMLADGQEFDVAATADSLTQLVFTGIRAPADQADSELIEIAAQLRRVMQSQ